ncbi:unnamed protein product [Lymnaea stagnalis]|uniref:Major facilitator superfamily (MFS) profile domain-containing protein n=1 Tax=Lymnaea stagnalis TaxID=6523 RepID=A0AAV2HKA3_LYMST
MDDSADLKTPLLSAKAARNTSYDAYAGHGDGIVGGGHSVNTADGEIEAKKPTVSETSDQIIKTYPERWYVLLAFSLYAFSQNMIWNTWGPISTTSEEAFGWSDSTIAWLNNWGPVSYVLCGLFFPWLLQVKGLRWAVLPSMFLVLLGSAFRVITSDPDVATILIHIGQFLNGVAGPVGMGAMPTLSSIWFPPGERVTATAIGTSISVLGSAIPFVVGPALVTGGPPKYTENETSISTLPPISSTVHLFLSSLHTPEPANVTAARITQEKAEIMRYMYYECGWSALIFLMIFIYFPSKPRHPPCPSATVERDNYWTGLWSLKNKKHFVILAVIYGISLGVLNCWASVLNVNLHSTNHISEDEAGWIGFYATIGSCVGSLVIGRFGDLFARQMKLFILAMFIWGAACFIVFALVLINVLPFYDWIIYVTVIGGNTLINSAVPMIYELGCELAYPTSEGAANGLLTYLNNVGGLIFLAVFSFPNVGTMWMNWTAIGSIVVCIPLIMALKGRFNRLEVDEGLKKLLCVDQEVIIPSSGEQTRHIPDTCHVQSI